MTFAQFLDTYGDIVEPGINAYCRMHYLELDRAAAKLAAEIEASYPSIPVMRLRSIEYERRGLIWLAEANKECADLRDRDPRLATIKSLSAAAQRKDGIGRTWVNWYANHLRAHVAFIRDGAVPGQPQTQPTKEHEHVA